MSKSTQEPTLQNPEGKEKWLKGLYIVLFLAIGYVMGIVILLITVLQFAINIGLHAPNKNLLEFSKKLASYFYEILLYVTFISEQKPFPFSPWPQK
jgi:energy-coupling factor transporter transmembrane protein EcfT